jgi:hypothetical protein
MYYQLGIMYTNCPWRLRQSDRHRLAELDAIRAPSEVAQPQPKRITKPWSRKSGRFGSQFSIRDVSGNERLIEHRIRRRGDTCVRFPPANSALIKV